MWREHLFSRALCSKSRHAYKSTVLAVKTRQSLCFIYIRKDNAIFLVDNGKLIVKTAYCHYLL